MREYKLVPKKFIMSRQIFMIFIQYSSESDRYVIRKTQRSYTNQESGGKVIETSLSHKLR